MVEIEQLREEIMLCMIEQDWFNWKVYMSEMEKIKRNNSGIYAEILLQALANIVRDRIDAILGNDALGEESE